LLPMLASSRVRTPKKLAPRRFDSYNNLSEIGLLLDLDRESLDV
jgi:hypothetical protein